MKLRNLGIITAAVLCFSMVAAFGPQLTETRVADEPTVTEHVATSSESGTSIQLSSLWPNPSTVGQSVRGGIHVTPINEPYDVSVKVRTSAGQLVFSDDIGGFHASDSGPWVFRLWRGLDNNSEPVANGSYNVTVKVCNAFTGSRDSATRGSTIVPGGLE